MDGDETAAGIQRLETLMNDCHLPMVGTVGELRQRLAGLDDAVPVFHDCGGYRSVLTVEISRTDGGDFVDLGSAAGGCE